MTVDYQDIPFYNIDKWETKTFDTQEDFRVFVLSCFKEPGKYNFNEVSSKIFKEQAEIFERQGFYCAAPFRSKDFINYWDTEKAKCRKGVIITDGTTNWYMPRDYYMWLNFLPIYNKEKKKFGFADIRDAQYHMSLYEILAELHGKHSAIFKKRQIASSYYHAGKLINQYYFEEGSVCKMGASLKSYINEQGTWKFLNEYRNFLNEHTAWYRPSNPDKVMSWQQKIKVTINGKDIEKGLKSVITGTSFEKDETASVGGPCTYFFHEEAGIAPKMDKTFEYILPALKSGMETTGMFIAAGSVGDLDQCDPLRKMILYPDENEIFAVETDLLDSEGTIGKSGLFIPEQWSMPPFIDKYGNSKVEEALQAIKEERKDWKKKLDAGQYQLRISQKPTNIEEGFKSRKESFFPAGLLAQQKRNIEEKKYHLEFIELSRNLEGVVEPKKTNKLPILEFPINPKTENKEGVLCVWERPVKDSPWGTYYASIDPVAEGKTSSSDSLCSIFIYKNSTEVRKVSVDKTETFVEPGKIVASWCGRFDDIKKTHQKLELIIEWYNAWTLVENNVPGFITYMINNRKQKFLVPKDQILFLKELNANRSVYQEYGWKNTGQIFKQNMLPYVTEFITEEIDQETDENGVVQNRIYGVERIPDIMLITEMEKYEERLNVDRLIAFAALVTFVQIQNSNRGFVKRIEYDNQNLQNSNKMTKLNMSPFKHMGNSSLNKNKTPRSPFKNLR
jgi:hypothetical protein